MTQLKFSKRFEMSELPTDWRVSRVTTDWHGNPLILVQEGKPPEPPHSAPMDARISWLNARPKAHHLIHWDGKSPRTVTFEQSTGLTTFHVQPFIDGWLLCEARGGCAVAYDRTGRPDRTLDLGDASNDVQTTSTGQIWVSYFDEGVYGSGIGSQQGVVCFDSTGHPIFKYFDFAEQHQLPFIDDCYSMNVANDDEVWLSYYAAFPLVHINRFQLQRAWKEFGGMDGAFGLAHDAVVFSKCYTRVNNERPQLLRRTLADTPQTVPIEPIDEQGKIIQGPFHTAARGPHFFLHTNTTLYGMSLVGA
jgi:hypothetical protein